MHKRTVGKDDSSTCHSPHLTPYRLQLVFCTELLVAQELCFPPLYLALCCRQSVPVRMRACCGCSSEWNILNGCLNRHNLYKLQTIPIKLYLKVFYCLVWFACQQLSRRICCTAWSPKEPAVLLKLPLDMVEWIWLLQICNRNIIVGCLIECNLFLDKPRWWKTPGDSFQFCRWPHFIELYEYLICIIYVDNWSESSSVHTNESNDWWMA